jgi:hypothetical protein
MLIIKHLQRGGYVTPNICYVEESDGIVMKPYIVPLLTFTVGGVEYQYEEGMTWEKWVNSDYNIDGYIIIEEQAMSGIHKHISLNNRKVYFQRSNGTTYIAVEYTDIIDSNYIYGLTTKLEPHY